MLHVNLDLYILPIWTKIRFARQILLQILSAKFRRNSFTDFKNETCRLTRRSDSASISLLHILRIHKVIKHIFQNLQLQTTLRQFCQTSIVTFYFPKIVFNVILPSSWRAKWPFLSWSMHQNSAFFFNSGYLHPPPAHSYLLHFPVLTTTLITRMRHEVSRSVISLIVYQLHPFTLTERLTELN
jgi:hypothetical protein